MQIHWKSKGKIVLKGMAMGAADLVPGVSGGTVALITGIYDRLVTAIGNLSKYPHQVVRQHGISLRTITELWVKLDLAFLISVATGIGISLVSLSRVLTWALEHYPPVVWSFFFGLIIASIVIIIKSIANWNILYGIVTIVFTAIMVWLSMRIPVDTPDALWFVFISGVIAITAMILPGISGSFLLVLLGKYEYILTALREFNVSVLAVFIAGCLLGILSSSRLISWLLQRFHSVTMAAITGVMIGSLYKVWPWRQVTSYSGEYGTDSFHVYTDAPVLPQEYLTAMVQGLPASAPTSAYVVTSVIAFILGCTIIVLINWRSRTNKTLANK